MTPTVTPPSTPGWGRLLDAALEIGAVLYDPGIMRLPIRRRLEDRHRCQWPALWDSIDELMRGVDALQNEGEGVERTPTPRPSRAEREALARITNRTAPDPRGTS